MKMLQAVGTIAHQKFVTNMDAHWTMSRLIDEKSISRTYPMARYATDVTLQQTNRPSGNM